MATIDTQMVNNAAPNFNQQVGQDNATAQPTNLEAQISTQMENWTKEVTQMNEMLKTLPKTDELLNTIYSSRQKCVESFYGVNSIILTQSKEYKRVAVQTFNNIKQSGYNGVRYTTDAGINKIVETLLEDRKHIIDVLSNYINYLKDTIATIDNIIYGINQKVKIHEMLNNIKF